VRKTDNSGAIADVCRSAVGEFLGASTVVVRGISDPATLKVMDFREALSLALDLQVNKVRIASDCMEIINILEGNYTGKFSSAIHEIQSRESRLRCSFVCA
jgi:hypothetical protein